MMETNILYFNLENDIRRLLDRQIAILWSDFPSSCCKISKLSCSSCWNHWANIHLIKWKIIPPNIRRWVPHVSKRYWHLPDVGPQRTTGRAGQFRFVHKSCWITKWINRKMIEWCRCYILGFFHEGRHSIISFCTSVHFGQSTAFVDRHGDKSPTAIIAHLSIKRFYKLFFKKCAKFKNLPWRSRNKWEESNVRTGIWTIWKFPRSKFCDRWSKERGCCLHTNL